MSDSLRKKLVFGSLVVAIVWGIWNNPFGGSTTVDNEGFSTDPSLAALDSVGQMTDHIGTDRVYASVGGWAGDPFPRGKARTAAPAPAAPDVNLKLTAISAGGSGYMAIINGTVVSENTSIEGWKVTSISQTGVVLQKAGRTRKLKVGR